ncbi:MAG: hypothetical protein B6I25_07570 [Planctomycetales bacterium 4572_13]|nr:MAG: hypothetical protein B6I25_07570 [Planctomycetales bacterium 4572_13]
MKEKTKFYIVAVLVVTLFQAVCWADKPATDEAWGGLFNSDRQVRKDAVKVLGTLDKDELLKQASGCAEFISSGKSEPYSVYHFHHILDIAEQKGFDISDAIRLIKSPDTSDCFKTGLLDWVGEKGIETISYNQAIDLSKYCIKLLKDEQRQDILRDFACNTTKRLLGHTGKMDLLSEDIIKSKMESGIELSTLRSDVADGKIVLSEKHRLNEAERLNIYDEYAQALVGTIQEPNTHQYFEQHVINGLEDCLKKPIESNLQVYNSLENAVRNYQNHDQGNWRYLAKIGMNTIKLPDANDIAADMITNTQTKFEAEEDEQKKFDLRSSLDSLKQTKKRYEEEIKANGFKSWVAPTPLPQPPEVKTPVQVEPVDVNEMVDFLEQLWLEDEGIRETMDPNQWQEFIEAVKKGQ